MDNTEEKKSGLVVLVFIFLMLLSLFSLVLIFGGVLGAMFLWAKGLLGLILDGLNWLGWTHQTSETAGIIWETQLRLGFIALGVAGLGGLIFGGVRLLIN